MEDKNLSCLIIQTNPKTNVVIGLEVSNTYNFWEKQAFVRMNRAQLFPCKVNRYVTFYSYWTWYANTKMYLIPTSLIAMMMLGEKNFHVFYPGY